MLVERWITSSLEDRESALISRWYGVPRYFILLLYWNWCCYRIEMGVSGNLWTVVKDLKPLVVYDVECETAMDSMKGKCASSWVDLGYTNLFCIPEVTSVFFSCCEIVLGDSLQFHQVNRGSLCLWLGPQISSARNAGESSREFSRDAAATWCIFSSYGGDGHLKLVFVQRSQDSCLVMTDPREVKLCLAGIYRRFWRWAVRPSVPY